VLIIPREAWKNFFAYIFSYQDVLLWHFCTLKTRKRRFQTICSHWSLALLTVAIWLPTDLTGTPPNLWILAENVVVASSTGSRDEHDHSRIQR